MKPEASILFVIVACLTLAACGDGITGQACMGADNDSLVENLQSQCETGDTIATKHPAYFCDFNHAIAYNNYNSAFCIYAGQQRPERTAQ